MDNQPYIVLVDDEEGVRESLARILTEHFAEDYQIVTAASGEEALELLTYLSTDTAEIALVLSDQRMPGIQGIELLAHVYEHYPRTKRVLVTAYGQDVELVKNAITQARVDAFIDKPVYPPQERFLPKVRLMLFEYGNKGLAYETLVDVLRTRAKLRPEAEAYRFLPDGEGDGQPIDYALLDKQARAIAAQLQGLGLAGERALLFYPSGLEFISAFFGCLYAGVIAVPAYPPRRNRNLRRLSAIIQDARPAAVLTTRGIQQTLEPMLDEVPALKALHWLVTDQVVLTDAERWAMPRLQGDDLALLQYTSGSTGAPKGVMVSHTNLLTNLRMMEDGFGLTEQDVGCGWLPLFHDMGLIGLLLFPLYRGMRCIFMPPAAFLQKPLRWLTAMSRFRATASIAPNFAFDLCVDEIDPAAQAGLDLSTWRFLLTGAEPVNPKSLDRFAKTYAPLGFSREAFYPSYGLAEATLLVTGGKPGAGPVHQGVVADGLRAGKVMLTTLSSGSQTFVGNGCALGFEQVVLADPEERTRTPRNRVGEIWVQGRHVAQGYWGREDETERTFRAHLSDTGEGPFMRTGDLGFIHDGELFITGRLKDVLIIRGRNHYPQDLEWTLDETLRELVGSSGYLPIGVGNSIAFAVDSAAGEPQLIMVAEVDRRYQRDLKKRQFRAVGDSSSALAPHPEELLTAVRRAVAEQHELQLQQLVLLNFGGLPKTSSGKVQRQRARQDYLQGQLDLAWAWDVPATSAGPDAEPVQAALETAAGQLTAWLVGRVAERLHVPVATVQASSVLGALGVDSVTALRLLGDLEQHLGRTLPVSLLGNAATIGELAAQALAASGVERQALTLQPDRAQQAQPFPLNEIQTAYWLGRVESLELGGVACHFYAEFEHAGLDVARLEAAWQRLIQHHGALRLVVDAHGQQRMLPEVAPYAIAVADLRHADRAVRSTALEAVRTRMSHQVYDTALWPLFEIRASILPEDLTRVHVSIDLLIADVWSLLLLFRQWGELYANPTQALAPLGLSFRDYVLAERSWQGRADYQTALAYWRARLAELPPAPELPLARPPATVGKPHFVRRQGRLAAPLWQALKQRGQQGNLTPSVLLATAFACVLATWSKRPHFTLNLTTFNRIPAHPEVEQLVGDFTALLPLAVDLRHAASFEERAERVQRQLWQDLAHRQVNGLSILQEWARLEGRQNVSLPVVFTSALGLQTGADSAVDWLGQRVYSVSQTPQVWLDHQVLEDGADLVYSWDAVEALFPAGLLDEMFAAYQAYLHRLAQDEARWQSLPQLTPLAQLEQRAQVNATAAPLPGLRLQEGVGLQARLRPSQIAVIAADRTWCYGELWQETNRIGRALRARGVVPGELVAVVTEKGWEQIVAVLGILQAGGAYLPIDPALPQTRIDYLLAHTDTRFVLSQSWVVSRLTWPETVQVFALDAHPFAAELGDELEPVQRLDALAYTIFTSGSTGTPKGVMIDHQGAINTVVDVNTRFRVQDSDRVLALSSLSFDLSVYDIFGLLGAGGALILPDPQRQRDPAHWLELAVRHQVTVWNTAPALMKILLEYVQGHRLSLPPSLRLVMLSGDWIPLKLPDTLWTLAPQVQFFSLGGATEASIWSIAYHVTRVEPHWVSIPYGRPMVNQTFHVLDSQYLPCPTWVPGELYIGGVGVALGYWRDPEKTAARFICNPHTGERLYRTGDLGRYWPDGNIEFLGREDFQVKIQGYRIELGEIEAVLSQHPAVKECVVSVTEAAGEKQLVAYVVSLLDLARAEIAVACELEDHAGAWFAAQATALSAQTLTLTTQLCEWHSRQYVRLRLHLPGLEAQGEYHGEILWVAQKQLCVQLEGEAALTDLRRSLAYVMESEAGVVMGGPLADPDSVSLPAQEPCRVRWDGGEAEALLLSLAPAGAQLLDLPADLVPGQRFALSVRLPIGSEIIRLESQLLWRSGKRSGVQFHSPQYAAALQDSVHYLRRASGPQVSQFTLTQLRSYLEARLPAYMVPKFYMLLENLPLSSNGKVDRRALPAVTTTRPQALAAPRNVLEQRILAIWQHILKNDHIGIDENFFEIGGYSQLAVRLIVELRDKLGVELPIRALFETPTIAQLAERIGQLLGTVTLPTADAAALLPDTALYGHYARRGIAGRIAVIGADKHYTRAQGNYLYYEIQGQEVEILDMVGGYGSTILGHNHPELVQHMQMLLAEGVPINAQHSNNIAAGKLGRALSERLHQATGQHFVATLASTGTEAVEAAVKHAKLELRNKGLQQEKYLDNLAALMLDQYHKGQVAVQPTLYTEAAALLGVVCADLAAVYQAVVAHNGQVLAQEPLFLALTHAFHGMTTGALSMTASPDFRHPFHWMGLRTRWIRHEPGALQAAIEAERQTIYLFALDAAGAVTLTAKPWYPVAALFLEPIQGEGGMHPVKPEFLQAARQLADEYGFPIVVDEIQCGMGRTGTFTAAELSGLRGDYYTFSKSLGGGLTKVSAMMVSERRYQDDFGYMHGSTFAEDRLGCLMALRTLELLQEEDILATCARSGQLFLGKLRQLAVDYPDVIREVRGAGLMLGVELAPQQHSPSFMLRLIAQHGMEMVNMLIAGYLLNVKQIRIAPTKTRNTIRFLPSALITEAEMERVIAAFADVCQIFRHANAGRLLRYVVGAETDPGEPVQDWRDRQPPNTDTTPGDEPRVAHIGHLEDLDALLQLEPSFAEVPEALREPLLRQLFPYSKIAIAQQMRITTATGAQVHLSIIGLPLTGALFEAMMRTEERELLLYKIDEAVQLAHKHGCKVVGFGGYTSIVTLNCTAVAETGLALTSGNAYTAALGIEGALSAAQAQGLILAETPIAVVGAKGNIGSICARVLAEYSPLIRLFGRNAQDEGLREVADTLYADAWVALQRGGPVSGLAAALATTQTYARLMQQATPPEAIGAFLRAQVESELGGARWVQLSDQLTDLADCPVIVSCTNSARPVIYPQHLSRRVVVICDIATPKDVANSVFDAYPHIQILSGGLARLPGAQGLKLQGTRLPVDHVYGCVAETTLLGVSGYAQHFSFGEMTKQQVDFIRNLAQQQGYQIGTVALQALEYAGH